MATTGGYPIFMIFLCFPVLGWASEEEVMTLSLWVRETVGGKRTYRKPNKKFYLNGTVFCSLQKD
jgi:hypothetical protein